MCVCVCMYKNHRTNEIGYYCLNNNSLPTCIIKIPTSFLKRNETDLTGLFLS